MPVHLHCACGKILRARDELIGKRIRCPSCSAVLLVEATFPPGESPHEAIQAPRPPGPRGVAAEPPQAHRRPSASEPEGPQRPRAKQAKNNLVLWLALGGSVGAIAVVAVVLVLVLGSTGSQKAPVRPGAGWKGPQGPPVNLGLNEEGFITTWLLLAPIPLEENQRGADALNREHIPGEARLRPRPGDRVRVGDQELVWREYRARDYFFDFNDFLGDKTDDSVGYAVCYIHAPVEVRDARLKVGCDDQARVYLNGQEVFQQDQARALKRDQDSVSVTLRRGANVLVFKVVNERIDWSGCARFTDRNNNILQNIEVTAAPR